MTHSHRGNVSPFNSTTNLIWCCLCCPIDTLLFQARCLCDIWWHLAHSCLSGSPLSLWSRDIPDFPGSRVHGSCYQPCPRLGREGWGAVGGGQAAPPGAFLAAMGMGCSPDLPPKSTLSLSRAADSILVPHTALPEIWLEGSTGHSPWSSLATH